MVATVSQVFLLFNDLDSFENHCLVVYRMSLSRDLSDVFLMVRLRFNVFWGDWVLFSSHHIRGTRYQHDITDDVDLDYLADVMCTRFLSYLSSPLPLHTVLCGRTSLCATHTQGLGVTSSFLKEEDL